MKEIVSQPFIQSEHPGISVEVAEALYQAIDTSVFYSLAKKFADDSYRYRSGWPDLTLVKGKEVRFVEVKTTDKLHKSQLTTIPMLKSVLPYKISVLRVRKSSKNT